MAPLPSLLGPSPLHSPSGLLHKILWTRDESNHRFTRGWDAGEMLPQMGQLLCQMFVSLLSLPPSYLDHHYQCATKSSPDRSEWLILTNTTSPRPPAWRLSEREGNTRLRENLFVMPRSGPVPLPVCLPVCTR
jgi:hypothetical protein